MRELKTQLAAQQSVFPRPNTKGKAATVASYHVSRVLAEHKKSFKDGEVVKEAFIEAADVLFGNFKEQNGDRLHYQGHAVIAEYCHTTVRGNGRGC